MKRALLLVLISLFAARAEDLKVSTQMVYSRPSVAIAGRADGYGAGNTFEPDVRAQPGVEVRYGDFGLSLSSSFKDDFTGSPHPLSGSLTDARTFYYGDAWGMEGYHRSVRGFLSDDGAVYHPDMTLQSTNVTVYRSPSDDFHVYRMADGLSESGMEADMLLALNVSHQRLRDDEAFLHVNGVWSSDFQQLRDLDVLSASLGAGFALSTNAGGVYFDPAMFVGFGAQYREWGDRPEVAFALVQFNLRMRLGYRTRWFDAGVGFENDAQMVKEKNGEVDFTSLVAQAKMQVYL